MILYKCDACGLMTSQFFKTCPSCRVECNKTKEKIGKENIYKFNMSYKDESVQPVDELAWDSFYLAHDKVFTKEVLDDICEEAKDWCMRMHGEVSIYTLNSQLKRYDFRELETITHHDFEERLGN